LTGAERLIPVFVVDPAILSFDWAGDAPGAGAFLFDGLRRLNADLPVGAAA